MNRKILQRVIADFPQFKFRKADDFAWRPWEHTIFYNPDTHNADLLLLHELAHGILGHLEAVSDVELLKLEAQAWQQVKARLAPKYGLRFDENSAIAYMDTYREWLHKRSLCPKCDTSGWQIDVNHYKCPACLATWQVNSNKFKRIKRVLDKK